MMYYQFIIVLSLALTRTRSDGSCVGRRRIIRDIIESAAVVVLPPLAAYTPEHDDDGRSGGRIRGRGDGGRPRGDRAVRRERRSASRTWSGRTCSTTGTTMTTWTRARCGCSRCGRPLRW